MQRTRELGAAGAVLWIGTFILPPRIVEECEQADDDLDGPGFFRQQQAVAFDHAPVSGAVNRILAQWELGDEQRLKMGEVDGHEGLFCV